MKKIFKWLALAGLLILFYAFFLIKFRTKRTKDHPEETRTVTEIVLDEKLHRNSKALDSLNNAPDTLSVRAAFEELRKRY